MHPAIRQKQLNLSQTPKAAPNHVDSLFFMHDQHLLLFGNLDLINFFLSLFL